MHARLTSKSAFAAAGVAAGLLFVTWFAAFHIGVVRARRSVDLAGFLRHRPAQWNQAGGELRREPVQPGAIPVLRMDPDARGGTARPTPRRAGDRSDPAGSEPDNPSAQAAARRAAAGMASSRDTRRSVLPRGPAGTPPRRCRSRSARCWLRRRVCGRWWLQSELRLRWPSATRSWRLRWHYPSDVLGGFLVATTWTLLGVAVLLALPQRRPAVASASKTPAWRALGPSAAAVIGAGGLALLVARGASARGCVVRTLSRAVHHRGGGDRVGRGGAGDGADARGTPLGVRTRRAGIGPAPTAAPRRRWPRARG